MIIAPFEKITKAIVKINDVFIELNTIEFWEGKEFNKQASSKDVIPKPTKPCLYYFDSDWYELFDGTKWLTMEEFTPLIVYKESITMTPEYIFEYKLPELIKKGLNFDEAQDSVIESWLL